MSEFIPPQQPKPKVELEFDESGMIKMPDWNHPAEAVKSPEFSTPEVAKSFETTPDETVTVWRNPNKDTGAPGYWDSGWSVLERYLGKDNQVLKYVVYKKVGSTEFTKEVTPDKVRTHEQGEVAGEVLRKQAQEDLGQEAAEQMVDFDDDRTSDQDDDLFRASSAAQRVMEGSQEQEVQADPLAELPAGVKDEVLAYRRAVSNKAQAERDKDFALAAEDGRDIARIRQTLSKPAKDFLGIVDLEPYTGK